MDFKRGREIWEESCRRAAGAGAINTSRKVAGALKPGSRSSRRERDEGRSEGGGGGCTTTGPGDEVRSAMGGGSGAAVAEEATTGAGRVLATSAGAGEFRRLAVPFNQNLCT
jgi:hypothetical protein